MLSLVTPFHNDNIALPEYFNTSSSNDQSFSIVIPYKICPVFHDKNGWVGLIIIDEIEIFIQM